MTKTTGDDNERVEVMVTDVSWERVNATFVISGVYEIKQPQVPNENFGVSNWNVCLER